MHLNLEGARVAADQATARWREGKPLSPIDGMPIGIKDIIETIDMPTEQGSPLFVGCRTERDAASVVALREAGAVIVGKTVTTEFAATEPRGTRNPHDLRRTPGGSSSGSAAAVASGMLSTALGTQVIGSTIRPASYCGCIGFKGSVGALNRGGSYDGLSQSSTGVLAATLEDAWQVAYEIAMRAGGDPGYPGLFGPASAPAPVKPRRVAFLETAGWADASPDAKQAMADALARLKAAGIDVLTRHSDAKGGRGRDRDRAGAPALDADQWLGIALAAQHLSRARRQQGQPRHARPARRGRGHDAGRLPQRPRAARAGARALRRPGGGLRRLRQPRPRPPPRRSDSNPPAIPTAPCMRPCSGFRRSRCRCCRIKDCRSACR